MYKTGFDELAYASYCDVPAQKQSVAQPPEAVIHLATIEDEPSMRFQVFERHEASRRDERNELVVRDLQPGVAYFWRSAQQTGKGWLASKVTYCLAAVCPVDYVDEAEAQQPPKYPPDKYPPDKYPEQQRPQQHQ